MDHVGNDFSKKAADNTEGAIWDEECNSSKQVLFLLLIL